VPAVANPTPALTGPTTVARFRTAAQVRARITHGNAAAIPRAAAS
jgi:hypothetical protein